jgi:hypothetical protein
MNGGIKHEEILYFNHRLGPLRNWVMVATVVAETGLLPCWVSAR